MEHRESGACQARVRGRPDDRHRRPTTARRRDDDCYRGRGSGQAVRRDSCAGRGGPRGPGGYRPRTAGAQRRRQSDGRADPGHAAASRRRTGQHPRPRPSSEPAAGARADRAGPRPVRRGGREPHRNGESRDCGLALRPDPPAEARRRQSRCWSVSGWRTRPIGRPGPTPAACAAGWTWRPVWSAHRGCCSWTNPPPGWTRARGGLWAHGPRRSPRRHAVAIHDAVPGGGGPARRPDRGSSTTGRWWHAAPRRS